MEPVPSLRRDLRRPSWVISRSEMPFLAGAAGLVIVAAQVSEPGTWRDVLLLVAAGAALLLSPLLRRPPAEPFAALVAIPVLVAVGHEGHLEVSLFLICLMTVYCAWHLGSTVRVVLIAVLSSAGIVAVSIGVTASYAWQPWVAAQVFTVLLGRLLARQRTLIEELQRARVALADEAVAQERRRIATELHDLAGHTMAAMLLHVTGARHVLERDPDEARRALADAESVGRRSMDQMRATVATLRTSERGVDPPLPEAGELRQLVAEYRRAGLHVTDRIDPATTRLSGPLGLAVHRIARESLANVARHAPTNRVVLETHLSGEQVDRRIELTISDHGRAPSVTGRAADRHGVIGMRERARSVGGRLEAGPTAEGWRVSAALPLPASPGQAGGEP